MKCLSGSLHGKNFCLLVRPDRSQAHLIRLDPTQLVEVLPVFLDRATLRHVVRVGELVQRSEEHTSELQSRGHLVCRLLLEKKKNKKHHYDTDGDNDEY